MKIMSLFFIAVFILTLRPVSAQPEPESVSLPSGITIRNPSAVVYENLELLCRVWGFLKYNHPLVAAGKFDWDRELFEVMPAVIACESVEEGRDAVYRLAEKAGPVTEYGYNRYPDSLTFRLLPPHDWIRDTGRLGEKLSAELQRVESTRLPDEHYYIAVDPYVGVNTLGNEKSYKDASYDDMGYRLLALFRLWNAGQYFFPYRNMTDEPWDKVLADFIPRVVEAGTDLELLNAFYHFNGSFCDSHAYLLLRDYEIFKTGKPLGYIPVRCRYIKGQVVVTKLWDENAARAGLLPGDVILAVNGTNVEELFDRIYKRYRGSNRQHSSTSMLINILRGDESGVSLDIIRNGTEIAFHIDGEDLYPEFIWTEDRISPSETGYCFVDDSIGYFSFAEFDATNMDSVMESFRDTKGIVVDLRTYPNNFSVYTQGEYFLSPDTTFIIWYYSTPQFPGAFMDDPARIVPMGLPRYKGKLVLIVNEDTFSRPEFTAMALQCADDVITIGSQTAGSDGDNKTFALPFGMEGYFTHLGVAYPDGTETQRTGIRIEETVYPTIESIREGRDLLLERAVEIIISGR